jgi:DHA1 family tetracycline resistance protein-like MFS transporter
MKKHAILFVVFLDLLGFGLILPILPFAAQSFGASSFAIGVLAAMFPALQTVSMPLWGRLSDRIGRRPVILLSVLGSVISYVIFGLAHSYAALLLSRALAGVMAANMGVAKAYIADLSDEKTLPKNLGLYGAAQALGFLVGPALGALLSKSGVRGTGFVAAAFSLLSLIFVAAFLSESIVRKSQRENNLWHALKANPKLLQSSVSFFLVTLAFSHLFIAFPLFTQATLGYGSKETGYFFVLLSFVAILVQGILFGKLARRVGERLLFALGLFIMGVMFLVGPLWHGLSGTIAFVVLAAVGYSLANPAVLSLISKSVTKDEQGLAAGVSESLGGFGRVLGPLAAGFAMKSWGVYAAFVSAAGFALLSLLYPLLTRHVGLRATVVVPKDLSAERKRQMYALFARYYEDVNVAEFERDLAEKDHVLLFWDQDELAGFSTLLLKKPSGRGLALFSGDTVLAEKHWGSKILQKSFTQFVVRTKLRYPFRKLYWMLISKGYKTYLLMRRNFPHSFPSVRGIIPEEMKHFKDAFYAEKFGAAFHVDSSCIHFSDPHGKVRGEIAVPDADALQNPEVQLFVSANPGYQRGDELACIAEIRGSDLLFILRKYVSG